MKSAAHFFDAYLGNHATWQPNPAAQATHTAPALKDLPIPTGFLDTPYFAAPFPKPFLGWGWFRRGYLSIQRTTERKRGRQGAGSPTTKRPRQGAQGWPTRPIQPLTARNFTLVVLGEEHEAQPPKSLKPLPSQRHILPLLQPATAPARRGRARELKNPSHMDPA